ncbi:MAG: hypothetical protein PUP91_19960 [Rhizonema sp. PD37]|nr:hypothetical protein [Rhizonema sp. PD37]
MYHFSESDLNIKSVAQLKDVYVQLGCTEVITDKRIKANWVQAILTHQSALVKKVTVAEIAQLLLQPKIEEQSTQYQDLLEQINHIRYAWEDSRDECINYEDGKLWLTATPESNIYVLWEFDKNEADVVNEILSKTSTPAVVEERVKICATCPSISTNVQSGLLIFKPVGCAQAYEVWNGDTKYGAIRMLEDGLWLQSYAPVTTKYGTPYAAATALIEAVQSRQARSANIQVIENWGDKFVVRNIQNGCYYMVQPNHPDPKERCECRDCHFRSVICKHQNAVADHTKIESLSNDIEVDSVSDPDFGLLYRVWKSWELLGTFYHALDGKWVAQPCESDARPRCETANQAQLLILAMAGMLVAGEVEEDLEVPVI